MLNPIFHCLTDINWSLKTLFPAMWTIKIYACRYPRVLLSFSAEADVDVLVRSYCRVCMSLTAAFSRASVCRVVTQITSIFSVLFIFGVTSRFYIEGVFSKSQLWTLHCFNTICPGISRRFRCKSSEFLCLDPRLGITKMNGSRI